MRIGPVADAILTNGRLIPRLAEVERASTDEALVAAMRNTGFRDFFFPFYEVLRFHAFADPPTRGLEGPSRNVYMNLMAWSAFTLTAQSVPLDIDPEITNYFLFQCLRLMAQLDQPTRLDRLKNALKELPNEVANYMDTAVDVFILLSETDPDGLIQLLSECPEEFAPFLPTVLIKITGLDVMEEALKTPTAISRHTITLRSASNIQDAEIVKAALQELSVLAEFAASDEICESLSVGATGDGQDVEIAFYSTKRAAKAFRQSLSALNIIGSKEQDAGTGY